MVRNYVRKTNRGSWPIENMKKAVDAVLNQTMGYHKASQFYGIPRATLSDRVKQMKKYFEMLPSEVTVKTEKPGSEDEQHEETVEVYAPYRKLKKMKPVPKQKKEAQDTTSHSFTTHSENEPSEETCSLMDSVEEPLISAYSLNATAMYWSEKLDNLDPTQKLYAEKFINEILLEAQLGNLGRYSIVINGTDQTAKKLTPVDSDCTPSTSSNNS